MSKLLTKAQHSPALVAWVLIISNIILSISADIHLPALPDIVSDLKTSHFLAQMIFLVFFLGAIFSRLIWGTVSDIYGRRTVLLAMLPLQIFAQYICVVANSIYELLFWRFIQSLGTGVVSVVGIAIIADLFHTKERSKYYGLLDLSQPIGFVIAPIIGAHLLEYFHTWRASFVAVLIMYIFILIACYLVIPETQARKTNEKFSLKLYKSVLSNKVFVSYTAVSALLIASHILYVLNAPFIFIVNIGVSAKHYAVLQLIPVLFNILGFMLYNLVYKRFELATIANFAIILMILTVPLYIILGAGLMTQNSFSIVGIFALQSVLMPLLIPILTSKIMELNITTRGLVSSCLASLRSVCQVIIFSIFSLLAHTPTIKAVSFANATIVLCACVIYIINFFKPIKS